MGFFIIYIQARVVSEKRPRRACACARAALTDGRRFLLSGPSAVAWRSPIVYERKIHIC